MPNIITISLADSLETHRLGVTLGKILDSGSVILLSGDLGAGKTTLVKGIGEGLGISEPIVSPTFTLINEYTQGRLPLYHLDLYRLRSHEVTHLNLETYWEGIEVTPGIITIEWAEKLSYKPDAYIYIDLYSQGENTRQAKISQYNCDIKDIFVSVLDRFKST
ncbi:MAG: tRNA (adenosine(37)-N6)-threonylcarbamoyltransferase complex ATPase subunit type 1 TsaE [Cyanobacteria bacterium P01_A01_bin.84]